ncbi:hypothetical protein C3943_22280 [Lysinibacillus sp. B2A1]|nr:hypothetical protein C3943_22280 [Lysinibacillus sp. B2A1]
MNILEEKLYSIYNQKENAPFHKRYITSFYEFITKHLEESRFLNPYIFSEKYDIDYATSIAIFLFYTNSDDPLLNIRPYIDCTDTECKTHIFLSEFDIQNNSAYCKECDLTIPVALLRRQLKFLFELNNAIYSILKMQSCTNTLDMILSNNDGLKFSPPSISYNDTSESQQHVVNPKDLEGGVSFSEITRINTQGEEPLSKPLDDIQKLISQKMLQ